MFYDIIGETKFRTDLFSHRCSWLKRTKDNSAKKLAKKEEVREKVKEAMRTFSVDGEDNDAWEALANAHLESISNEESSS